MSVVSTELKAKRAELADEVRHVRGGDKLGHGAPA